MRAGFFVAALCIILAMVWVMPGYAQELNPKVELQLKALHGKIWMANGLTRGQKQNIEARLKRTKYMQAVSMKNAGVVAVPGMAPDQPGKVIRHP